MSGFSYIWGLCFRLGCVCLPFYMSTPNIEAFAYRLCVRHHCPIVCTLGFVKGHHSSLRVITHPLESMRYLFGLERLQTLRNTRMSWQGSVWRPQLTSWPPLSSRFCSNLNVKLSYHYYTSHDCQFYDGAPRPTLTAASHIIFDLSHPLVVIPMAVTSWRHKYVQSIVTFVLHSQMWRYEYTRIADS